MNMPPFPLSVLYLKRFARSLMLKEEDEEEGELDDEADNGDGFEDDRTAVTHTTYRSNSSGKTTQQRVGSATMGNYLSALTYLYKENGIADAEASRLTRGILKKCLTGLKRDTSQRRQDGDLQALEGKAPLTFVGYTLICHYALEEKNRRSSFCWLYVMLCWNLVSRSNNVVNLAITYYLAGGCSYGTFTEDEG